MNLATHILKKDIRHSAILLAVWLLLIVLQFVLIGSAINPGDRLMQGLYSFLSTLVPLFQILVLIVIVPHVIQGEPLVGTTAFWLTRPISRGTLLGAKALFAIVVLIIPPLVAEVIVLAANGTNGRDISLAIPEIVMQQLALILCVAVLASVASNFGRFAIMGAVLLVVMVLVTAAISWIGIYLNPEMSFNQYANFPLVKSRSVAASLLMIAAGCVLVSHQYLTLRTKYTIAGSFLALLAITAVQTFWPWNFLKPNLPHDVDPNFNPALIKAGLDGSVSASDIMSLRGQGAPQKNIQTQIATDGASSEYLIEVKNLYPALASADGRPVPVKPRQEVFYRNQSNADALEFALGGVPVVNPPSYSPWQYTSLFTLDPDIYRQYASAPLKFSAQVDFLASKYIVTAEMPLAKGSRYDQGSQHVVITDILTQPDGVDIVLRQRTLNLLFDLQNDQNPQQTPDAAKVVYLLLNKKRGEAVLQKQTGSFTVDFSGGVQRLVNHPLRLSFGSDDNNSQEIAPDLSSEWLADAVLARLELVPVASFSKEVTVDQFRLYGQITAMQQSFHGTAAQGVSPEKLTLLHKIVLPASPTRDQIAEYVRAILAASQGQTYRSNTDPQVGMIEQVGPEHLDVLLDLAIHSPSNEPPYYLNVAIQHLARPEDKALILQALPADHDLIELVAKYGWEAEARDTLISVLGQQQNYMSISWIKSAATLKDPATYPGLKAYFIEGQDTQQTYDAIKDLPSLDLSDAVDSMWKKARYGDSKMDGCEIAARYGHADALDAAAEVLALNKVKNSYAPERARKVITECTPATGDDNALVAWVRSNHGKLVFNPQTRKYAPQQ